MGSIEDCSGDSAPPSSHYYYRPWEREYWKDGRGKRGLGLCGKTIYYRQDQRDTEMNFSEKKWVKPQLNRGHQFVIIFFHMFVHLRIFDGKTTLHSNSRKKIDIIMCKSTQDRGIET